MDVTIFIRTRNEGKLIRSCLEGVFSQQTRFEFEVIVLDSQSEDDTQAIVREFDTSLYTIPKELFSYSKALNFGVQKSSSASFFVPLSGHCVPVDERWLQNLVAPLSEDVTIGASFSRQIPWDDATRPEKKVMESSFPSKPRVMSPASLNEQLESGEEAYNLLAFSNASCCVRRDILLQHPYLELPFAEDRAFAFFSLQKGAAIFYAPDSVVLHSHEPDFREFRQVARAARLARAEINAMVFDETELGARRPLSPSIQALKIPLVVLLAALMPLVELIKLHPLIKGWSSYRRTVRYYCASVGTTVGKLEAALSTGRIHPSPVPADPGPLIGAAEKLK